MPWKETAPMKERVSFCALQETGVYSMTELCERFGISRKTGYKWLGRYQEQGVAGLQAQSRAPHACPHRLAGEVAEALLSERARHPHWGPKKLRAYLAHHQPELDLPAASTVGELLLRHGLTQPRSRRRKPIYPSSSPPLGAEAPNAVWCADFKGEFRTQDGQACYPLTVTD